MTAIRTNAAAKILGVSASTLRTWERRYGFPLPQRSAGGHRLYCLGDVEALRLSLAETQNVSSAIAIAMERGEGPSSPARLAAAYAAFDEQRADRVLEEGLAIRSVERTAEELLLGAVERLAETSRGTPEYELAIRHGTAWMSAIKRLSPPATRAEGVLMFDAAPPLELDAIYALALELALRRAGLRTLCVSPSVNIARLGRATRAVDPWAVILTGSGATLDTIGRFVYAVRAASPGVSVLDYRGAVPETGASTVIRLGDTPIAARDALLRHFNGLCLPEPVRPIRDGFGRREASLG
jgi:DNA-binding transcriptional MerR regulator